VSTEQATEQTTMTWQQAVNRAIHCAMTAEQIANDPKTPVGSRVIAYAHASSGWAEIAAVLQREG
jgi:hypothetical protein